MCYTDTYTSEFVRISFVYCVKHRTLSRILGHVVYMLVVVFVLFVIVCGLNAGVFLFCQLCVFLPVTPGMWLGSVPIAVPSHTPRSDLITTREQYPPMKASTKEAAKHPDSAGSM